MAFDLTSIRSTYIEQAPKVLLMGDPKIGKSTFAARAPHSVGILTEDGMTAIAGQAFPLCRSLPDVMSCLHTLYSEPHDFQTVYLDSLDALEPLIWQDVCARNNWKSIEQPGYGKGYLECDAAWRELLEGFTALRNQRGMAVILICHIKIARFESPTSEGYDMIMPKLHARASALMREWADVLGYAALRTMVRKAEGAFGNAEAKAVTTGERILHVTPNPAYLSGNRYGIQSDLPLDFAALCNAIRNKE